VENFASESIIGYSGSISKLLTCQAKLRDKKAEGTKGLPMHLLHKMRIKTPEIYQLARGADFCMVKCFAHVQHRGRIEHLAVLACQ
jgi:hypothetical protein